MKLHAVPLDTVLLLLHGVERALGAFVGVFVISFGDSWHTVGPPLESLHTV